MAIDLRARPIVITGASSGIGRATAVACARAGMPVCAGARRVARLEELAAEVRAMGGRCAVRACDVTSAADCAALVEACERDLGPVYAVFANAGAAHEIGAIEAPDEEYRATLEVNFFGTLNTIRPAIASMRREGSGHVLVCSSCLAKSGLPRMAPYTVSKAAQDHLARAMRAEFAGSGIHVSGVYPIGTRTEFHDHAGHEPPPMGRMLMQDADVVARAVVRCLKRPRGEVWTSTPTRLLMALGVAFPSLADAALRRQMRAGR
ncbi:MAG TPA: SDR family oxidoreductase [Phycisphaerales bacterium]|nr:SDR family oxidoreductase [Phycisphaerales bacterium]